MTTHKAYYAMMDVDPDDILTIESEWRFESDPEYVAEDCAKDYYEAHEGWDLEWPQRVRVFESDEPGARWEEFDIGMQLEPLFYFSRVPD